MASTQPARVAERRRRPLRAAALCCALALAGVLESSGDAFVSPPQGRRAALQQAGAGLALLGAGPAVAVVNDKGQEIYLGFVPAGFSATTVGEKVTTPNGLEYEPIEIGSAETGPRVGPPRSGSVVYAKFVGHTESFTGPVFDSSMLRGGRKADKQEYVEMRLNQEPTMTNGLYEALKLMKVGGKGRFIQPPNLSYSEGRVGFDPDDDGEVKGKIPPGQTLYYTVELIQIVKP
mmetsp:Transcript_62277/g.163545  ORF Transcript_62277/g.163545 Transcript_62277/m.163545 type:complete len:233 (-) Transcript_62277:340-1038(-)